MNAIFKQKKEEAKKTQSQTRPPEKGHLAWRFAQAAPFLAPWRRACGQAAPDFEGLCAHAAQSALARQCAVQAFCAGGDFRAEALPEEWAAKGVVLCALADAPAKYAPLLKERLFTSPANAGSEILFAQARAEAQNGMFLYVPQGVVLEKPIALFTAGLPSGDTAVHHFIALEEGAKASCAEICFSAGRPQGARLFAETEAFAGRNAHLETSCIQLLDTDAVFWRAETGRLDGGASWNCGMANIGGGRVRHEWRARLCGAGADAFFAGLDAGAGGQFFDRRTHQMHESAAAHSDLLCKSALNGGAQTVFSGMIRVEESAGQSESYQSFRGLLLDGHSRIEATPALEIKADDVSCSHGAAFGPLDAEALFYLRSRGVGLAQAKAMLVEGFLTQVVEAHAAAGSALDNLWRGALAAKLEALCKA